MAPYRTRRHHPWGGAAGPRGSAPAGDRQVAPRPGGFGRPRPASSPGRTVSGWAPAAAAGVGRKTAKTKAAKAVVGVASAAGAVAGSAAGGSGTAAWAAAESAAAGSAAAGSAAAESAAAERVPAGAARKAAGVTPAGAARADRRGGRFARGRGGARARPGAARAGAVPRRAAVRPGTQPARFREWSVRPHPARPGCRQAWQAGNRGPLAGGRPAPGRCRPRARSRRRRGERPAGPRCWGSGGPRVRSWP
jgi:hypothetical protein